MILARKIRNAGVHVELHLCKGQPHNYAAMPTAEGRQAQKVIVNAIRQLAAWEGQKNRITHRKTFI